MRVSLMFLFSVLIACNSRKAPNGSLHIHPDYEAAAQKWFDTIRSKDHDEWIYANIRLVTPNPNRYDSLASVTGLPKRLFVYLDALNMPYKPDVYRKSNGHQILVLNINPKGYERDYERQYKGVNCDNLNIFSMHNAKHINKYILTDSIWDAMTFNFIDYEEGSYNYCRTNTINFSPGDVNNDLLDKRISNYLDNNSFSTIVETKDSITYVKVLKLEHHSFMTSEDKYRLASFSPIIITGIMREKAKEIKDIVYITNRYNIVGDKVLPPTFDTALIIPTYRWLL